MAEQDAPPHPEQAETQSARPDMLRDWISLWQSEFAALASDREAQESWQRMMRMWSGALAASPVGAGHDPAASVHAAANAASHASGAAASAWASALAHAFGWRAAEFERLAARVTELERRLAELERRS